MNDRVTKWVPTTDLMMLRRMGKTAEECSELIAVLARCIIQGIDEIDPASAKSNRQRLMEEVADVQAQLNCTVDWLQLNPAYIAARCATKEGYMRQWEGMFCEAAPAVAALPQEEGRCPVCRMADEDIRQFGCYDDRCRYEMSLAAAPQEAAPKGYWMLERNSKHKDMPPNESVMWFKERKRFARGDDDIWTPHANKARHFKTKEEAQMYIQTLEGYDPLPDVTEHMDCDGPADPQGAPLNVAAEGAVLVPVKLLIDIQSNAATGAPDWSPIEQAIHDAINRSKVADQGAPREDQAEVSALLSMLFSVKVINVEEGNYWRCPQCSAEERVSGEGKHAADCPAQQLANLALATPAPGQWKVQQFVYLLNALDDAAQSTAPFKAGYNAKRKAVLDYVRALSAPPSADERQQAMERDAARYKWLRDRADHVQRRTILNDQSSGIDAAIDRALSSAPKAR